MVAFTSHPMRRRRIGGRWYEAMRLDGVFAIGERRVDPPAATDTELKHQHAVVVRLAELFDAVLPVRFGAVTSTTTLAEMPASLVERLADGLEDVRDKAQMTIRFMGEARPVRRHTSRPVSGREYLLERQAAATPDLPPDALAWLDSLRPAVVRERIEPGAGSVLATVYHLVPTRNLDRYTKAAANAGTVAARVTGPFPPFAFTPVVL